MASITEFEEGETYRNAKLPHDIMVLGIAKSTKTQYVLAVLLVDRESQETTMGTEITVAKADLGDWAVVEY